MVVQRRAEVSLVALLSVVLVLRVLVRVHVRRGRLKVGPHQQQQQPAPWRSAELVFTADGLRHGFSLGVDVTKMRGHRRYSNYKSAVDAAVSVSRAIGKRVETLAFRAR